MTKIYTVMDGVSIGAASSVTSSVTMENPGLALDYALTIKGSIASADIEVDVEIPNDTEQYETTFSRTAVDISQGNIWNGESDPSLHSAQVAETVHVTVTNNDAGSGSATVKLLQHESDS